MSTDVFNITASKDAFTLTAKEGAWDSKKTLKIAHCTSALSDTGGAGFINDKIAFTVKGTMHATDVKTVGNVPRPTTQTAQTFLKKMRLTKYKRGGACEFESV